MPAPLDQLESQRDSLLKRLLALGDFRPGSISATSGRCGKPACHCHQPGQPGHGPNWRLTYKRDGKTVSESLPDEAALRKATREIAAYREFQQLSRQLLDVNLAICRQRPPQDGGLRFGSAGGGHARRHAAGRRSLAADPAGRGPRARTWSDPHFVDR